jgi:hypothetical protein
MWDITNAIRRTFYLIPLLHVIFSYILRGEHLSIIALLDLVHTCTYF